MNAVLTRTALTQSTGSKAVTRLQVPPHRNLARGVDEARRGARNETEHEVRRGTKERSEEREARRRSEERDEQSEKRGTEI
jgi:hypothetical protein